MQWREVEVWHGVERGGGFGMEWQVEGMGWSGERKRIEESWGRDEGRREI